MPSKTDDQFTLTVNGAIYAGWLSLSCKRRIDAVAGDFTCHVTERAATQGKPWQITPFSSCVLKIGADTILTGYVDEYQASLEAIAHRISITGRSKTEDLVDCSPDIRGGQFKGYNLEQIARAICQPFGIGVTLETNASQIFPDATLQRGETAITFLERLSRLSGVLLTDDVSGNLVLTRAGISKASGQLVEGSNLLAASTKLDVKKRFSSYIIKGQRALGSAAGNALSGFGTSGTAAPATIAPVVTNLVARAQDTGVPRYRPHVRMAEAQLDQAGMQRRADWERNFAFGRATEAQITVSGWRQPDGTLWKLNQLISVSSPGLHLDQDLLIAGVTFNLDEHQGQTTRLEVGPVEGFTPDPGQVKLHCKKSNAKTTTPAFGGFGISN